VFFWQGPAPEPQTVWYARRTPWVVHDRAEAMEVLQRTGQAQGIIVRPSPDGPTMEVVKVP